VKQPVGLEGVRSCSSSVLNGVLVVYALFSYIITNRGMHAMYEKYRTAAFGRCPHVFCQGQPVLPVGLSDLPRNYTVNVFCPRCHGLFFPKSTRQANIDGAYFGTTFPHLYLICHPVSVSLLDPTALFSVFSQMASPYQMTQRIWSHPSQHKCTIPECMVSRSTKQVYTI
jgi:Casein kinase II regulatory subunit